VIPRRGFLERLGMGAGAALLSPVARTLLSEAQGAESARKRIVFVLMSQGIHPDWNFSPSEYRENSTNSNDRPVPVLNGPTKYTWPNMLKPLERYRDRMLLLDGLTNVPKTGTHGHSAGYSALSCFPAARGGNNDSSASLPGGISIDQFIANSLGASTRVKSVLWGVSRSPQAQLPRIFAAAAEKPEPHNQSPALMMNDLFGASAGAGAGKAAARQRLVFDGIRTDIKRLQGSLGAPERRAMDHYLGTIEEFEKRQQTISAGSCQPGAMTGPLLGVQQGDVEDRMESMNEMALLALTCGLTNVVGVSIGCGMSHDNFPTFNRIARGTPYENWIGPGDSKLKGITELVGHGTRAQYGPAMDIVHQFVSGLIARMADGLSTIKEGDATILDNTVFVYTSENGEQHHSDKGRWPVIMLGNAGGKLRSDGRFIRYPVKGQKGNRSMADLFCSLSTASGVPTDSFGKGGNETVSGPLPELMA
jgi:hypothetical protein